MGLLKKANPTTLIELAALKYEYYISNSIELYNINELTESSEEKDYADTKISRRSK